MRAAAKTCCGVAASRHSVCAWLPAASAWCSVGQQAPRLLCLQVVTLTPLTEALWLSMVRNGGKESGRTSSPAAQHACLHGCCGPPHPQPRLPCSPLATIEPLPPLLGQPHHAQIMSACAGFLAVNVVLGALWVMRRQRMAAGARRGGGGRTCVRQDQQCTMMCQPSVPAGPHLSRPRCARCPAPRCRPGGWLHTAAAAAGHDGSRDPFPSHGSVSRAAS